MTVAELIEALKQCDPEAVIVVSDGECGGYIEVEELNPNPRFDYRMDKSTPWIEIR